MLLVLPRDLRSVPIILVSRDSRWLTAPACCMHTHVHKHESKGKKTHINRDTGGVGKSTFVGTGVSTGQLMPEGRTSISFYDFCPSEEDEVKESQ